LLVAVSGHFEELVVEAEEVGLAVEAAHVVVFLVVEVEGLV